MNIDIYFPLSPTTYSIHQINFQFYRKKTIFSPLINKSICFIISIIFFKLFTLVSTKRINHIIIVAQAYGVAHVSLCGSAHVFVYELC